MPSASEVLQTGTTTTYLQPLPLQAFKWFSAASSTGRGAKFATGNASLPRFDFGRIADRTSIKTLHKVT
jgi:hypothetical protein